MKGTSAGSWVFLTSIRVPLRNEMEGGAKTEQVVVLGSAYHTAKDNRCVCLYIGGGKVRESL